MLAYHFRLYDQRGERGGHFLQCTNDGQAQTRAQEMLDRHGVMRVEVWRDGLYIYEAKKGAVRPRSRS